MKKVMFLLAAGVMCLTACAQKKGGERGPHMGGGMSVNKDSDSVFAALKQETLGKFKQLTYNDKQTGKTMEYNLLVPEGAEADQKLPLVLFMADASTAGKEVTAPLTIFLRPHCLLAVSGTLRKCKTSARSISSTS